MNYFKSCKKTRGGFCGWECCGNKFGRISRRSHGRNSYRQRDNRVSRMRRYAKRSEANRIKFEISESLNEMNWSESDAYL